MNPLPVALVLASTLMHAGWNLLARHERSETFFFRRMLAVVAVVGLVPIVVSETLLSEPFSPTVWICIGGSGFFCSLYFLFLARAYESADFTIVYPVARALPVLLVAVGDLLCGRQPTAFGWLGMSLVMTGCFLAPLSSFQRFDLGSYMKPTSLWMILTALATVGYTLLDKTASEIILPGPASAARYGYLFFLVTYFFYAGLLALPSKRSEAPEKLGWKIPAAAGALNFSAYWLVLWAYQLSRHASYIVAFRQFSIVIGVVVAFGLYKEHGIAVRMTGTLMITSGLVLIGLWGG
jgi:drug/metabolite transporter (DMT)-like permease